LKVFVYCNSVRNLLSVKALEGEQKGSVVAHVERIALKDVEFRVQDGGRRRARKTGVKNVHAGCVGTVEALWGAVPRGDIDNKTIRGLAVGRPWSPLEGAERVRYNPHETDSFVREDTGAKVVRAERAHLDRCSIVAAGLK
jgi:hypothetical protein